ncbi:MAG: diphthamide synthesis protein [Candidatus Pacearchaeota archaeon]|jgi:diphthamide biosynthesis enzyme Dph1/Dph2-like protein
MKILYIESTLKNSEIHLSNEELDKLPKNLVIAYSIQFKPLLRPLLLILKKRKIKVFDTHQVLGCSKLKVSHPILFIGSGKFHISNLYLNSDEIYILENNHITNISSNEIESVRNKRKTALLKFLSADNVGILVSTKPGQEFLDKAIKLKQDLSKKDKKAYIFLAETLDINQFENFNIDSWVNTACSGLANDNPYIIDITEIKK